MVLPKTTCQYAETPSVYQLPLDIYIGSAANEEICRRMLIQLVWVLILAVIFFLYSKKVLKKVLVQGG